MPERRRLPPEVRRERILVAALELFAEHGYQAAMGAVAQAAGVTRTVLYHYFPSKEQLFLAVLDAQASALVGHLARPVTGAGTQTERARDVIDAMLVFVQDRPAGWRLLFDHDLDDAPEVADARRALHERTMLAMGALLASDMSAAGLNARSARTMIVAEASLGAAVATARWWREHPEIPRGVVTDALYELLWHGTGALPADAD
ncbi:MAG: TetR/AcrR family transcriptional regulator [Solirubrobacteraceae bacterium]|nr:TetR/AcrR family transcriptional regulator [Solirubrobacteraceae bacterium]